MAQPPLPPEGGKGRIEQVDEALGFWQVQWAEEQVRRERCAAAAAEAQATAQALHRRRLVALDHSGLEEGALASGTSSWLTRRFFVAWRSWLRAEKSGRQFEELAEELRREEEEHKVDRQRISEKLAEKASENISHRSQLQGNSERHLATARYYADRSFDQELSWAMTYSFRCWRCYTQAERNCRSRWQHLDSTQCAQEALQAVWTWRASTALCRRAAQRSDVAAEEAALPEFKRRQCAMRCRCVIDWVAEQAYESSRVRSALCQTVLQAWYDDVGATVRLRSGAMLPRLEGVAKDVMLMRSWSAWKEVFECSRIASACREERSEALLSAANHCALVDGLVRRSSLAAERWLMLAALQCWRSFTMSVGLRCALDQLQQEKQAIAAAAESAGDAAEHARLDVLRSKEARAQERATLESQLADAQQGLLRLQSALTDVSNDLAALEQQQTSSLSSAEEMAHELSAKLHAGVHCIEDSDSAQAQLDHDCDESGRARSDDADSAVLQEVPASRSPLVQHREVQLGDLREARAQAKAELARHEAAQRELAEGKNKGSTFWGVKLKQTERRITLEQDLLHLQQQLRR